MSTASRTIGAYLATSAQVIDSAQRLVQTWEESPIEQCATMSRDLIVSLLRLRSTMAQFETAHVAFQQWLEGDF